MLPKYYFSRTIDAVSAIAISAVLLGVLFATPSCAMQEEGNDDSPGSAKRREIAKKEENDDLLDPEKRRETAEEEESCIKKLPHELWSYTFSFLPLESYGHVSLVCKSFQNLVQNPNGPFKDWIEHRNTYRIEKQNLLRMMPDTNSFSQILGNLRKSLKFLSHRSQEDRTWFTTPLFDRLKARASQSHNFIDELNLKEIWLPLALLRSCDKFWDIYMQHWLENTILPGLQVYWPRRDALRLLTSTRALKADFNSLFPFSEKEQRPPFALELCERGQEGITAILDYAYKNHAVEGFWKLGVKYYALVFAENPDLAALHYAAAGFMWVKKAELSKNLEDWKIAAKHYDTAIKKTPDPDAAWHADAGYVYMRIAQFTQNLRDWQVSGEYYREAFKKIPNLHDPIYLNAGYVAAKAGSDKARIYFEKFILKNLTHLEWKLLPDTLDLMEKVLTEHNSQVPFRQWIEAKRKRDLETKGTAN